MQPRVFVTQETSHDFRAAEQFGTVEFVTAGDLNNMRQSLHNERLIADVKDKLKDFDPERDWLVITGSPYVSALVFLLLGMKKFRSVRILRWDNRDFCYVPLHIELRREIMQ